MKVAMMCCILFTIAEVLHLHFLCNYSKYKNELIRDFYYEARYLYLNGFHLIDYCENKIFYRLGEYVGFGFCYEATALNMLTYKDFKTRMVFGDCMANGRDGSYQSMEHCWMEVKFHGAWWVIDSAWLQGGAEPCLRNLFYKAYEVRVKRVISNRQFWNLTFSQELYSRIQHPETSYVMYDLIAYRATTEDRKMVLEQLDIDDDCSDGRVVSENDPVLFLPNMETPVSQAILRDFIYGKGTIPKKKHWRRANRIRIDLSPAV